MISSELAIALRRATPHNEHLSRSSARKSWTALSIGRIMGESKAN
jgi:hypothetical protein